MGFCLQLLPTHVPNNYCNISDVEFKMPDCNECQRIMTNAISKFKGVASCVMDTENQKIVVTGNFNLEKLLKKLMKVTRGKEVEIVTKEEKVAESEKVAEPEKVDESEIVEIVQEKKEETEMVQEKEKELETVLENDEEKSEEDAKPETIVEPNSDENKEIEKFMMFSDENPNAKCTIS